MNFKKLIYLERHFLKYEFSMKFFKILQFIISFNLNFKKFSSNIKPDHGFYRV